MNRIEKNFIHPADVLIQYHEKRQGRITFDPSRETFAISNAGKARIFGENLLGILPFTSPSKNLCLQNLSKRLNHLIHKTSEIDHMASLTKNQLRQAQNGLFRLKAHNHQDPETAKNLKAVEKEIAFYRAFKSFKDDASIQGHKNKAIEALETCLKEHSRNPGVFHLDLSGLNLTKLPPIPHFVKDLDISNNQLETLPESLKSSNIEILDCSNNRLVNLENAPERVVHLDASSNQIEVVPKGLHSLENLDLSGNSIRYLSFLRGANMAKGSINFQNNPIETIDTDIFAWTRGPKFLVDPDTLVGLTTERRVYQGEGADRRVEITRHTSEDKVALKELETLYS